MPRKGALQISRNLALTSSILAYTQHVEHLLAQQLKELTRDNSQLRGENTRLQHKQLQKDEALVQKEARHRHERSEWQERLQELAAQSELVAGQLSVLEIEHEAVQQEVLTDGCKGIPPCSGDGLNTLLLSSSRKQNFCLQATPSSQKRALLRLSIHQCSKTGRKCNTLADAHVFSLAVFCHTG